MTKVSPTVSATLLVLAIAAGCAAANFGGATAGQDMHEASQWLLTPFFLLIGVELRAEFLHSRQGLLKKLSAPFLSAALGATIPALVVLLVARSQETQAAWPVPVATDLTLTLAVFALATKKTPSRWRLYLLAFAVFDDVFGILALNGSHLSPSPSLIGVCVGLFLSQKQGCFALKHLNLPTNYVLIPVFAFFAALFPVQISSSVEVFTLVALRPVGKFLGIASGYYLALLLKLTPRVSNHHRWVAGLALLGGMGFTVSFSTADTIFQSQPGLAASAKLATLLAAALSGLAGFSMLRVAHSRESDS